MAQEDKKTKDMTGLVIASLPVNKIVVGDDPSRAYVEDKEELAAFAQVLKSDGGLTNPITVKPIQENGKDTGRFKLLAGRRRLAAYKLNGWTEIEATVRRDIETAEDEIAIAVSENLGRKNPSPLEAAIGFDNYAKAAKLQKDGGVWSGQAVATIAKRFGISRAKVSQHLSLLKITDEKVRKAIHQGVVGYNAALHFRDLLELDEVKALPSDKQAEIAEKLLTKAEQKELEKQAQEIAAAGERAVKRAETQANKPSKTKPTPEMQRQTAAMSKEIKEKKRKAAEAQAAKNKQRSGAGKSVSPASAKAAVQDVAKELGVNVKTKGGKTLGDLVKLVDVLEGTGAKIDTFADGLHRWSAGEVNDEDMTVILQTLLED